MKLKASQCLLPLGLVLLGYVLLVGCTPSLGRFDSLANQGILPLSNDNPHLGSTCFWPAKRSRAAT